MLGQLQQMTEAIAASARPRLEPREVVITEETVDGPPAREVSAGALEVV